MSTNAPPHEGVEVKIGGTTYIIPPLNFRRIKKLAPLIDELQGVDDSKIPTPDQLDGFLKIIHSALTRNYPEMTMEETEEIVDLGNLHTIISAIMGVSGFIRGETKAGGVPGPTGTKSMPT